MPDTARHALTVMVVDDSKVSRNLAVGLLRNRLPGAQFVQAADGDSAVALFGEQGAQLVVMDYNMPGINGIEAAQRIQALDPSVVVVLLTANGQAAVQARATACGITVLCKPIDGALADRIAAMAPALV